MDLPKRFRQLRKERLECCLKLHFQLQVLKKSEFYLQVPQIYQNFLNNPL